MSTKRDAKRDSVQRLLPEGGVICEGCGKVVKFRLVRSKPCKTQPGRMIAYLACPVCGHKATQIRIARRARKHIRYIYEP